MTKNLETNWRNCKRYRNLSNQYYRMSYLYVTQSPHSCYQFTFFKSKLLWCVRIHFLLKFPEFLISKMSGHFIGNKFSFPLLCNKQTMHRRFKRTYSLIEIETKSMQAFCNGNNIFGLSKTAGLPRNFSFLNFWIHSALIASFWQ